MREHGRALYAADPQRTRGRRHAEPPPRGRTEYQRDRDRIIHSTAFRRLEYKTQVFVNHEGDLFRTRLTHSLEVAQIGRSVARSLRLDEDLTEAIALAHDLGHTPFGHSGQDALNACMKPYGGFEHNLQSLRVVDVLEQRWAAAEKLFDEAGIEAVDYFTGADPTEIKKIISDELAKGDVQGVWMDAGDGGVAAIEAFEDAGVDYPVMTGEDEMSFLRKWEDTGLTGLAPVYSNFQWRTPLLAVQKIFAGEEVPAEWVLPQVPITEDERADYLEANDGMPDGHYAKFGGEDLPGYPEVWQERQIP